MPLKAPELDDRTYDQLRRQALLRIPRYTPEWTDFNESDPGVTLLELFAWLSETLLFRMNQVPERNYVKFLQLLGMELKPAQPARAYLTFVATEGAVTKTVRLNSQIAAQAPGSQPLVFETISNLDLIRLPLKCVQIFDGAGFTEVTSTNETLGTPYRPFGWAPQVGSALYLGFAETPQKPAPAPRFPQQMHFRVFLTEQEVAGQPIVCTGDRSAPTRRSPVKLQWEYRLSGQLARWKPLNTYKDESLAFTREGDIEVEGPPDADHTQSTEGLIVEPLYWLRVRLIENSYPAGRAPRIDCLRPNVVAAENLATVRNEFLGASDASANQTFTLRQNKYPIVAKSLQLSVKEGDEPKVIWTQVDDFLASSADDNHYTLNSMTGEIHFGDGRRGRIPPAAALNHG